MQETGRRKGLCAGTMAGVAWGLDAVILGVVLAMAPFASNPVLLLAGGVICSALHDILAAVWLYLYMGIKGRLKELPQAVRTREGRFCALAALLGGPLAMTAYTMGIAEGGAALTASVSAVYPILGAALAAWFLKEKTGLQTWAGLVICVVGVVVIGWTPSAAENINVAAGIFLALIAALGWASEAVVCSYGMSSGRVDPELALLIRYTVSAAVYLLVAAPAFAGGYLKAYDGFAAIFSCTPCWILLAAVAGIGMVSFLCWYVAIKLIGAARALCLNIAYAFWAVLFSFLLSRFFPACFSGALSWHIAVGAVLILSGVALSVLLKAGEPEV